MMRRELKTMTNHPPDLDRTDPGYTREADEPEPAILPRWVPVLIGVVLVSLAALAVVTGIRYRDDGTITRHVRPRQDQGMAPSVPGEPGAGQSFVLHGDEGSNVPTANEPVTGRSRAEVTGGPEGVNAVVRIWARRGMVIDVEPPNAMVFVNDMPVGQVRQFDTMDEAYDFPEPGSYTIRIVAPEGTERFFIVTAGDEAKEEIAWISGKLTGR